MVEHSYYKRVRCGEAKLNNIIIGVGKTKNALKHSTQEPEQHSLSLDAGVAEINN